MAKTTAKPKQADPHAAAYTSVYLDAEARAALSELAEKAGTSRSHVIRGLISEAEGSTNARLTELVAEMADLLNLR